MDLTTFMPYIWISIAVFALIIEAATSKIAAICFLPPAIISLALSLSGVGIAVQSLIFFIFTAVLVVLRFTLLRKKLGARGRGGDPPELLTGRQAMVTEALDSTAGTGKVRLSGREWRAVSADGSVISVGSRVTLVEYKADGELFVCGKS